MKYNCLGLMGGREKLLNSLVGSTVQVLCEGMLCSSRGFSHYKRIEGETDGAHNDKD